MIKQDTLSSRSMLKTLLLQLKNIYINIVYYFVLKIQHSAYVV